MNNPGITEYEKAYDSTIWDRQRAVAEARETLHANAAARNLRILEESITFTIQMHTVPAIQGTFGERPGFGYWTIQAKASVVFPVEAP